MKKPPIKKTPRRRLWRWLLPCLFLCAGQRASAATALFQSEGGLFDAPFPSARWSRPDGGLALPPLPKKADKYQKALWKGFETDNQGFSVAPLVVFPLSGSLDTQKLPAHPRETILRAAPVFLMAIQPGARDYGLLYPLTVRQVSAAKGEKASHYLVLQPMAGVTLEPGAWYAAVLTTGLKDKQGEALKADLPFLSTFGNTHRAGAVGFGFGLLHQAMASRQMDLRAVAAATVFQTGKPFDEMFQLAEYQRTLKTPVFTPQGKSTPNKTFCRQDGHVDLPLFLHPKQQRMWFKLGGQPAQFGSRPLTVSIFIPARPVPGPGFPVVVVEDFAEGLKNADVLSAVSALASQGVAAVVLHEESVLKEMDFDNFRDRDFTRQRAVDVIGAGAMVREAVFSREMCPAAAFKIRFSRLETGLLGIKEGRWVASSALAAGKFWRSGVFSESGYYWWELNQGFLPVGDPWQSAVQMEHLLSNMSFEKSFENMPAPRWLLNPPPATPPKHVLLIGDTENDGALALAGGLEAVGEFPKEFGLRRAIEQNAMVGLKQRPLPVRSNQRYGPMAVTAAWVFPARDKKGKWTEGQWRQVACFFTQMAHPQGPEVLPPTGKLDAPCPAPPKTKIQM